MNAAKPFENDKRLVYEAYKKVKANRGSAGIDGVNMEEFDKDLSNNLYRLWNRMSSGSYMPQSVKLVEIPKSNGGKRPLGIPTISTELHRSLAQTSFDYLGFTFRPRVAMNFKTHKMFTTFSPAISKKAKMIIHEAVKSWKLSSKIMMSFGQLASYVNPSVRGWVNYYARFNKTEFRKVTQYLNESLARWMRRKYKGLHRDFGAAKVALAKTAKKLPNLFAHWTCGYRPHLKLVN